MNNIREYPLYKEIDGTYTTIRQNSEMMVKVVCRFRATHDYKDNQFADHCWKGLQHDAVNDQWVNHLELISMDWIEAHDSGRHGMYDLIIEYYRVYTESFYNAMILTR